MPETGTGGRERGASPERGGGLAGGSAAVGCFVFKRDKKLERRDPSIARKEGEAAPKCARFTQQQSES